MVSSIIILELYKCAGPSTVGNDSNNNNGKRLIAVNNKKNNIHILTIQLYIF